MRRERSLKMVTAIGSAKSVGLALVLLSLLLCVADSYSTIDLSNRVCEECSLQRNWFFSKPIYQCMGCCFSRAFPTSLKTMKTMTVRKNITSEATCCVASRSKKIESDGAQLSNHTECHCSTCYHHKI